MTKTMRRACAALASIAMAACAGNAGGTGGAGGDNGGETLRVVVQNDGTYASQVRVYLVPAGGRQEIQVGTMSTLGTETLTTRVPNIQGTYTLRAEGGTSFQLVSPRFSLAGNETITWDMRQNRVRQGS